MSLDPIAQSILSFTNNKSTSVSSVPTSASTTKAPFKSQSYPIKEDSAVIKEVEPLPPQDVLVVKIKCLRLTDIVAYRPFLCKIGFMDQILYNGVVNSISARDKSRPKTVATGTMSYDPSDYMKMSMFADNPLTVHILPLKQVESNRTTFEVEDDTQTEPIASLKSESVLLAAQSSSESKATKSQDRERVEDISCCNIDIMSLFDGSTNTIKVTKHMEPLIIPPLLQRKSWDNLPRLTLKIAILQDPVNQPHRDKFADTNFMKITLIGAYNMTIPFNDECSYTAASLIVTNSEIDSTGVTFEDGRAFPNKFSSTAFYPGWESLRKLSDNFATCDEKWICEDGLDAFENNSNINLEQYVNTISQSYSTLWASFHRTFFPKDAEEALYRHICRYQWPVQLNVAYEFGGYSYVAYINLFRLLYPGEDTVRVVVPLQWLSFDLMYKNCGILPLIPVVEKIISPGTQMKSNKDSGITSVSTDLLGNPSNTGADENPAFILIEIKLGRALVAATLPPVIDEPELTEMLKELEESTVKRACTGRGQMDRDWQSTVRAAINALRKVPYFGTKDLNAFMRQLAESRTRVELITSFWQDAAIYVNNNFVVEHFLDSDNKFEEMLMMAHACLMRLSSDTILEPKKQKMIPPLLRAARHARQMQDTQHAVDLYMQLVSTNLNSAGYWRELSTCLKDLDPHAANVCIDKSLELDPRHPLTLISKGCMIMEKDSDAAEPFFWALIILYPFWFTGSVVAHAYYLRREEYSVADTILENIQKSRADDLLREVDIPRAWERELGDWWDPTPLLPGMSPYYDAADLLLRLRAFPLAELCVAQGLTESGECAQYYHMVALCCRLSGDLTGALCHLDRGLSKYGEISYLRTLQGECYIKCQNPEDAMVCLEKAGTCAEAYSILLSMPCRDAQKARAILVDLIRRQPCAYAWMALADDWIMRAPNDNKDVDANNILESSASRNAAAACAVQALKWDRFSARAWALLSKIVPIAARRTYYRKMATECGYPWCNNEINKTVRLSPRHLCHRVGTALGECKCCMCQEINNGISAY